MKICNICRQRIVKPYTQITFTFDTHDIENEWEFCEEHARMVRGFLLNLRNEVWAMQARNETKTL